MEAAAAAGWQCIGVRTGGFGIAELYDAGAVQVFDDVAELLDRIDETHRWPAPDPDDRRRARQKPILYLVHHSHEQLNPAAQP